MKSHSRTYARLTNLLEIRAVNSLIFCRLQHFVVNKSVDGKSNFKRRLTHAIESVAEKYRTAVLPVFIDNGNNDLCFSADSFR